MQTDIGYLEELREDLPEAAWREGLPARRRRKPRRPRSRAKLVAVLAAASLVAAGGTGYVALFGTGLIADRAGPLAREKRVEPGTAPMPAPAPETGFRPFLDESSRAAS